MKCVRKLNAPYVLQPKIQKLNALCGGIEFPKITFHKVYKSNLREQWVRVGGFWVTYDALDDTDAMYRKAARYTCTRAAGFTTSQCTKVVAKCTTSPCLVWDPGTTVTLASAATKFSENKAILLNVKEFSIARVNQKVLPDTIFNDAYQVLRFKLVLSSTDKSNLINVAVEKTYHFSIRAMNISMVRNYD